MAYTDINGNEYYNYIFNQDGTIVVTNDNGATTSKISYDSCVNEGFIFDPKTATCYWSDPNTTQYNIIINPQGSTGALFIDSSSDNTSCILDVSLQYGLKFKCDELTQSLYDTLYNIDLDISVSYINPESSSGESNLIPVYTEKLFKIDNFPTYFNENDPSGIILEGDNCSDVINKFKNEFDSSGVTDTTFGYSLIDYNLKIDDVDILNKINNKYITLVITGDDLDNYYIVLDNVKMNRVCTETTTTTTVDDNCPSYDLKKVFDNKKSWVDTDVYSRTFNLPLRNTVYNTYNDKLVINTKETDILISPGIAITSNLFKTTYENPCLLKPATNCTPDTHECVDLSKLMTIDINNLNDEDDLYYELIDVKSRKTISEYPDQQLLFYRYLNSEEHCGVQSTPLDYSTLETYNNNITRFWSDIIEQVVPSTTLWKSSFQYTQSFITSEKYVYRKYTSVFTPEVINITPPSPTTGSNSNVSVLTIDISNTEYFYNPTNIDNKLKQTSNLISLNQINDGSEFYGTFVIVSDEGSTEGGNIILNETIGSNC